MKKCYKILFVLLVSCLATFNMIIVNNPNSLNKSDISLLNIKALAQTESKPNKPNNQNNQNNSLSGGYKSIVVEVKVHDSYGYYPTTWGATPYETFHYIYIHCCVSATKMEACDFSMSDPRC